MTDIREYILDKARELGIDIIGFTDCSPLVDIQDYLLEKKKENKYTEFEEKDLAKRIDPRLTLESCRSIIVLGISYNVDYKPGEGVRLKGNLSRSSWGIDYHRILKNKTEALIEEIEKEVDFQYRYFVDTGPLVDRELAKKAGIGYYGKNCSIINREYGSFIFIAYILTDLDIENRTEYIEQECGDCTLCIRACPTNALEEPYRLNPKRCVSYLTQTKDIISEELRHKMGAKIYGCDTCQMVCPKNKGIKRSTHKDFIPLQTKGVVDIEELFHMSNREFKEKYGHMAGSWRGKNTLKRNAIIALGNIKDKESLYLLEEELKKGNESLKEYILWAIDRIKGDT
ncbi:MAG: tRNA epoxyqueuosine(34) reductase QueG [Tissierellaceae bacterium]